MSAPSITVAVPLLALLAAASVSDLRARRIPNGLSLGGAAFGLLINAVAFGPSALGLAVVGWAVCLVTFLPLYATGGTAAGDVKLMAMVGAFVGPVNGFMACVFTLIAGALLASLTVAWRHLLPARLGGHADFVDSSSTTILQTARASQRPLDKIPYAAAIALGGLAAALQPPWLTNWLH